MIEELIKIVLAIIIGGLIGVERENVHRPAGFRTHILVCVGSTLVMMTSLYIFKTYYPPKTQIDVARLGAQVISGIGFLGAGTIIKDGVTVKGLTTAATLWAVSCIGLAIGIGYYQGAIITFIAVYLTLIFLKKIEIKFISKGVLKKLSIEGEGMKENIQKISSIFEMLSITIKDVNVEEYQNNTEKISYTIAIPENTNINELITEIYIIKGIKRIFFE
ncbi:MgtC/SapB family protein [Caldicellulosiruptoraceae bacterium PP1]